MKHYQEFNEGILDLLTKKGREKRGAEKADKKSAEVAKKASDKKTSDKKAQEDKDFESWKRYNSKSASPRGTPADNKKAKDLEKLPHVKARVKAMRDKANSFGGQSRR